MAISSTATACLIVHYFFMHVLGVIAEYMHQKKEYQQASGFIYKSFKRYLRQRFINTKLHLKVSLNSNNRLVIKYT